MKRIVVIGPESTGKTTLAQQLAHHFNCPWVPEFAREYLDNLSRPYREADLLKIARGQVQREAEITEPGVPYLFCDTDLRVIKIWGLYKYGRINPWVERQLERENCHLYLLTDVDLPWTPDPQREHPQHRRELYQLYLQEIRASKVPYTIVSGQGPQRFHKALKTVEDLV